MVLGSTSVQRTPDRPLLLQLTLPAVTHTHATTDSQAQQHTGTDTEPAMQHAAQGSMAGPAQSAELLTDPAMQHTGLATLGHDPAPAHDSAGQPGSGPAATEAPAGQEQHTSVPPTPVPNPQQPQHWTHVLLAPGPPGTHRWMCVTAHIQRVR